MLRVQILRLPETAKVERDRIRFSTHPFSSTLAPLNDAGQVLTPGPSTTLLQVMDTRGPRPLAGAASSFFYQGPQQVEARTIIRNLHNLRVQTSQKAFFRQDRTCEVRPAKEVDQKVTRGERIAYPC